MDLRRICMSLLVFFFLLLSTFGLSSCHKDDENSGPSLTMRETITGEYERIERASVMTDIYRPAEYYYFEEDDLLASLPYYDEDTGYLTVFVTHDDTIPVKDDNGTPILTSDGTPLAQHRSVTTMRTLLPDGVSISSVALPMAEDHSFSHGVIAENGVWYISFSTIQESKSDIAVFHVMTRDGTGYQSTSTDALFASDKTQEELYRMSAVIGNNGTVYVAAGNELSVLSEDFERLYAVAAEEEIQSMWITPEGNVMFLMGQFTSQKVMKLDEKSRAAVLCEDISDLTGRLIHGVGADYYLQDEIGVWSVVNGERKLILNQYNSALHSGTFLMGVVAQEVFAAKETDNEHYMGVTLYRHAEDIPLSEVKVIEVANAMLNSDPSINLKLAEFNQTHPEYYIVLTDTVDRDDDYSSCFDRICFNIGNGFYKPDIILTDANSKVVDTVLSKSIYQDLMPFMKEDSFVRADDLFGAVLSYFSDRKEGLWGICPSFSVTTVVGREDTLGRIAKQNSWTLEEELDFLGSRPQGAIAFDRLTQETWVRFLLGPTGFNRWVDYESGECFFDRNDFSALLRFLKSLPKDYLDYQKQYSILTELSDMEQIDLIAPYRTGQIILQIDYMQGLLGAWTTEDRFGTTGPDAKTNLSVIGYPSETGGDTMTLDPSTVFIITSYCEDPDVAWELICSFFTDAWEYPIDSFTASSFPSLESSFERYAEVFEEYYLIKNISSENPNICSQTLRKIPVKGVPVSSDPYVQHIQIDKDFVRKIRKLLKDTFCTPYIDYMPSSLEEIIMEEISSYLKGGSDEAACVRYIQSRAGIWLAEHK